MFSNNGFFLISFLCNIFIKSIAISLFTTNESVKLLDE